MADDGVNPTQYYQNRLSALATQKAAGVNPYPHAFQPTVSVADYVHRYSGLADGEKLVDVTESLAGRIMSKRTSSSSLLFYDLHRDSAKVHIMADVGTSELGTPEEFSAFHSGVKAGDVVGVSGFPGKSSRGELSIFPARFVVLLPCLHMLPRQPNRHRLVPLLLWAAGMPRNMESYALKDQETRYR